MIRLRYWIWVIDLIIMAGKWWERRWEADESIRADAQEQNNG